MTSMKSVSVQRRQSFKRRLKRSFPYYLLLLLPIAYLFIFHYMPMWGLQIAFRDFQSQTPILQMPWRGLHYFEQFFSSALFWQYFRNTVAIAFYSLLAGFPLPIILAICLNECRFARFKKSVQMVTYMPFFISTVVLVAMILQFTARETGVVNHLLEFLGFNRVDFMARTQYFRHIFVWTGIWQSMGFNAIIYLAALSGISQDLIDAAKVDGCNKWRRVWHIDLPGILPTITILLILNISSLVSVGFERIFLMQNPFNLSVSEVLSTYIWRVGVAGGNYSFSAAAGLFNNIIAFALILIANFTARRVGETSLW
ncbi:MAG: ABC transporter permease subunit [Defluviitaleaceae bacterium]|nr:ABC transporter permease subunit [Defluviitaleaceae bacterium]